MAAEEKWQDKYMQFQVLQQQIEQIAEHTEMLNQQNMELEISRNAVEEIGKTKEGNDILAPVANGIFIKSKLLDNKKLVVNVGANTTVEKNVDEVVKLLNEQQKGVIAKIAEAEEVLMQLQQQAMKIYEEVEAVKETAE
jgi:prefoldin alpha subunit